MARVNHKAVLALGSGGKSAKEPFGRFHLSPTHLTDQVSVRLGRQVIRRGTVSEVRVNDNAQSLEFVEVAVNRREMNVRRNALNLFGQFFGRPMRTLFEETTKQNPSRSSGATAALAQQIQNPFDLVIFGRGFVASILGG
jgi:hypothetical protein